MGNISGLRPECHTCIKVVTKPVQTDESLIYRTVFNEMAKKLAEKGQIPALFEWKEDTENIGKIDGHEISATPEAWAKYKLDEKQLSIAGSLKDAVKLIESVLKVEIEKVESALKIDRQKYVKEALSKKKDVVSTFDAGVLSPSYKRVVKKLLEAIPVHRRLFEKQMGTNIKAYEEDIKKYGTPLEKKLANRNYEYSCSFFGGASFLGEDFYHCAVLGNYPLRTTFSSIWPEGMSIELFNELKANAEKDKDPTDDPFLSPFTLVRWSGYETVNWTTYHKDKLFAGDIEAAAKVFEEAAAIGKEENEKAGSEVVDKGLIKQLESLAKAYRSDDPYPYKQSYIDKMNAGGPITLTVGPFEVEGDEWHKYKLNEKGKIEEKLLRYHTKAAFQMVIGFKDDARTKGQEEVSAKVPELEKQLAALVSPDIYKPRDLSRFKPPTSPFIQVISASGDGRASRPMSLAHNLPNLYRDDIGFWIESFGDVHKAKTEILMKIADIVLVKGQRKYVSDLSFADDNHYHEVTHGLGPAHDKPNEYIKDGVKHTIIPKDALGEYFGAIEEAKSDAGMIWISGTLYGQESEKYLKDITTILPCLIRSSRFGVTDSHGEAGCMRLGYFLMHGAAKIVDGKLMFVTNKVFDVNKKFLAELITIEATGDKEGAKRFRETYLPDGLKVVNKFAEKVNKAKVPIDVDIQYKIIGLK